MTETEKIQLATQIMCSMLSNPNVLVYDHDIGWRLCNSTTGQLAAYAVSLLADVKKAVQDTEGV